MSLSTKYDSSAVEDKWYAHWMEKGFFHSTPNPDKEPYAIVIPPPNVTGVLHMGHMLNNTIQDVLIRKARMEGKEACWVPGTDHASIATEAKVVRMLREKGIKKSDLTREEFLAHAWEWKEKYGGIILEQLKKLGASCDWDRTSFTMDDHYYKAVIKVFVDLYNKGYLYRGLRMVNWDVEAKTTVSNEEVLYREGGEVSKLYSVKYKLKDSDEFVVIATQRPETIMGDTAIAVNPTDDRFKHLIGKKALVPFINREIPIIGDEYVELDFGTGCLKVTPAHDPNDYEIGQRHNLEIIDTINDDGTLNEKCEIPKYVGRDRFEIRKQIVKDLKAAELLVEEKDFTTRIGRSERTDSVVEPKLSLQWFIKMKDISRTAHKAVMDDEILLHPPKFKNTYNHWMENVKDWCISRQLWWGQQIPAYYYGTNEDDYVVAETIEEALEFAKAKSGNSGLQLSDLKQDEDVLDTWASSWLFPLEVFKGFDDQYFKDGKITKGVNKELDYYYPTATLVTAPEILFFWVARMIIAGYEYTGEKPFKDVYLTGIVRDKQRRKMSKSLGNSPDPLDLIAQYGADAVRTGMLFSSPAGNDLLYDEKLIEQGRNFANKIWNAFRLVQGWEVDASLSGDYNKASIAWFEARFNETLTEVEDHFSKFRMSDALMSTYKLIWGDFCSWYLEMIKPDYQKPIDAHTKEATIKFFEKMLKLLHPFMPFITEELWHELGDRKDNDCIIVSEWPKANPPSIQILKDVNGQDIQVADPSFTTHFEYIKEGIALIRKERQKRGLKQNEIISVTADSGRMILASLNTWCSKIQALAGCKLSLGLSEEKTKESDFSVFSISGINWYLERSKENEATDKESIKKELAYTKGFLQSIEKKLSNERFVNNAPEQVVAMEKKKMEDAQAKIKVLENSLATLN